MPSRRGSRIMAGEWFWNGRKLTLSGGRRRPESEIDAPISNFNGLRRWAFRYMLGRKHFQGYCDEGNLTPTVIETSKWTKLVMVKACKAFGVNVAGFEHELLDMELEWNNGDKATTKTAIQAGDNPKRKKKGENELKMLLCDLIQHNGDKRVRGRKYKAFSG
ncbi:hypothetical protein H5410_035499 [Solanum commersonii]|uniref:Uncharacterized protein n=1 Tax=Solanum commersonii TaxID=4109 RepID=A0A9J5Y0V0_SOLCO|nr:hypothetical protein H5410_035499 [Solanum commersonii]